MLLWVFYNDNIMPLHHNTITYDQPVANRYMKKHNISLTQEHIQNVFLFNSRQKPHKRG